MLGRLRHLFGGETSEIEAPAPRRRRLKVEDPHPVVYAVGDVHGCLRELTEAESRIADDPVPADKAKLIVHLGDYVDRGPDSAGVLDYLSRPSPHGIERVCLCGNHDDLMTAYVRNPAAHGSWLGLGGHATLKSYGITSAQGRMRRPDALREALREAIPAHHLAFIDGLPVSLELGDVLFVHAGVHPARPLEDQTDHDMMWIREPFLSTGPGFPVTVVHGHTPAVDITTGPGRIGIDTAACVTGRLSVLRVDAGVFTLL